MKPWTFPYQIVMVLIMLLHATVTQAQLTTSGDVAGGYLSRNSMTFYDRLKHAESKGNLWLAYKSENYDWRLTVSGSYKDVDGERITDDVNYVQQDSISFTETISETNNKPLKLTARYDFNWRRPDRSSYSIWTQYDYEHTDHENAFMGMVSYFNSFGNTYGRFEVKEDVGHRGSMTYDGTTQLLVPGWVLKSHADVSLLKRRVEDAWLRYQIDIDYNNATPVVDIRGWIMNPYYTDYAASAALQLTDTVYSRPGSRLVLGGGVRFWGEGERFLHDKEAPVHNDTGIKLDTVYIDQKATGFRYYVEPFLTGEWSSGKWSVTAGYGLRLYHTSTTDKTGHAVALYNLIDEGHPIFGNHFSHFIPLATGHAQLSYTLSRYHRLTLTNSLSNRFPTNQQTVLCFVQADEYNKVLLGNPNLKPEVRTLLSLDHTLTCGHFSATTGISAERVNNLMEYYLYGWNILIRHEIALMTLNVADVTTYKLSETLAWNSKWLTTSTTLWRSWAHYQGTGSIFGERVNNEKNWGWLLNANVNLGHGWLIAANFQVTGDYKTLTTQVNRTWQSSSASIEKRFRYLTLYLNGSKLLDPPIRLAKYNTDGDQIYSSENRQNNRIVMLGCRWSL